jgi:UDP-N-acetylmuramoylalanine--D-glutamate ligase
MHDGGHEGAFAVEGGRCVVRMNGREEQLPLGDWLKLPGRHNLQNTLAAVCATMSMGVDPDAVRRGIESYVPLPHRLQLVGESAGVRFYNDSLATTPESAIAALEAFTQPTVILAGGYDKKVDLSAMAATIASRASAVALMGQTAGLLEQLIRQQPGGFRAAGLLVHRATSLDDAFAWAVAQARPKSVVLLSPGCASYDWFRNFAERGDQFASLVREWCSRGTRAASSTVPAG